MNTAPLLVTLGDPNGLGPELVCRVLAGRTSEDRPLVLIGPEGPLVAHCERLGVEPFWSLVDERTAASPSNPVSLLVPEGLESYEMRMGEANPEGGRAAGLALEAACRLLTTGDASGVVTCPLNKAMLQEAGFDFPGHTEFFAERLGSGRENICMHLCGPKLRVSLVTTHPALADVPELVTHERVVKCLKLTWELVSKLERAPKPVAVCGLNPHAGESGKIGHEDDAVIVPAIAEAQAQGIDAVGPIPGDTVFHFAVAGRYSAVLAMYHDQGLAPLKLLHFGEAVNITLGLPVVRTSVDHGTGYDVTGTGKADHGSLAEALRLAEALVD